MKKIIFLLLINISFNAFSQNSGKGFSYQAVARAGDGQIKASTNIEIQFSLLPGVNAITPTWQETHVATTDEFGICNLTIGKGIKSGGTIAKYSDLDYSSAEYWLKVDLKDNGIFQEIHKMQLLSVPYSEVSNKSDGVPIGSIIAFGADTNMIPNGWLLCNGRTLNRLDYNSLYKIIGNIWGAGDGATTFHLPDLSGLFLRGVDFNKKHDDDRDSRTVNGGHSGGNTGNRIGSEEAESFKSHTHEGITATDGTHNHKQTQGDNDSGKDGTFAGTDDINNDPNKITISSEGSAHSHKLIINSNGGNETRPDNAYVNYIIKFK